ncbi:hypothetical protein A6R68_14762 [Neotoma lepida]|uniref:UDENN domain-containing protein n=1 Tax=Neotoma lepida TaxID=56216 RepID=A0A1A6H8Q5_NEOLE|nr:hypothetical protein A6R68_14762 [Neotoma lepida]
MGSTEKRQPLAVFDWFFEAGRPHSLEEDPQILRQFPPDFREREAMQMVPKFCFPFDVEREPPSPAVQHFTFALTDLVGNRRFGFCRLRAVFYKILNTVGDLLAQNQVSEAEELLQNLQENPLPGPGFSGEPEMGSSLSIWSECGILPPALGNSKLLSCFVAPDSAGLPSIPENRNLTELVVAVKDENIVGLFAALLAERRVLLTASKLSTLTACVHASCALLYPMRWEHRVREKALEDVVVLNADSNTLETPFDDVQALPPDVVSATAFHPLLLKMEPPSLAISGSLLFCQVSLLRLRLRKVALSPGEGFIETRLEKLNAGEGFSDQFEQEIIDYCGASSGALRSYQLWVDSLKKGGDALLHSMKAKTRPAVKNMYRSAKSGLKGVQNLLMTKDGDSGLQRGGSLRTPSLISRSDRLQQRLPISQHFGQNRPLRPSRRLRREGGPSEPLAERSPALSPEDTKSPWAEETLDGSFLGSGELDLLSEILDSLSMESKSGGRLRASQSLDCCQQGASESCFSLPDIPARSPWQLEEDEHERSPELQPWSLPGDLPSLQDTPSLEVASNSKNCSQPPSDISPQASSVTSADPSSQGDPEPPALAEPDPRIPQSPCSTPLTVPTQPSLPESPQLLVPTKLNSDTVGTLQSIRSPSHSNSPEKPRNPETQVLWDQAQVQPLKELGVSNRQGPPARQHRVADLKKCFEN